MTSKKFDRQRVQHCMDVLDELAHSELSMQAFAKAQGMSYYQVRAWKSFEARWRAQLAGQVYVPAHHNHCARKSAGFVQVSVTNQGGRNPMPKAHPVADGISEPSVHIECTQGERHVTMHWPTGAPLQCAQWLKAYLA